ncbi:hypothetical protein [Nevskia ramosa]|uniref:hypothetical protein n=1 Tax=Nevskia ramosa TaxID=64002 RepID=UPI003D0A81E0
MQRIHAPTLPVGDLMAKAENHAAQLIDAIRGANQQLKEHPLLADQLMDLAVDIVGMKKRIELIGQSVLIRPFPLGTAG